MVIVTLVLACIAAFCLGFFFRSLLDRVKALEGRLTTKLKPEELTPESTLIDPEDIVQVARFEQEEIHRNLNPELNARLPEE